MRDHKFHSGYAHSSMDRDTLFRNYIKLKSKQREIVVHLSLCAFANAFRNEAMSVSSKINEMVCPLSNFESRLLCFLPICEKAFFSELTAGRIFSDFPIGSKTTNECGDEWRRVHTSGYRTGDECIRVPRGQETSAYDKR